MTFKDVKPGDLIVYADGASFDFVLSWLASGELQTLAVGSPWNKYKLPQPRFRTVSATFFGRLRGKVYKP